MYVPVHVLPMNESVLTDILGMGWVGAFLGTIGYRETEIKSNRYTYMPKALGTV